VLASGNGSIVIVGAHVIDGKETASSLRRPQRRGSPVQFRFGTIRVNKETSPMAPGTGQAPNLLADLTPAQPEAVTHFEGPLLILAGAGSGKTRVITRRVAWLLTQGVKPWNILAITFTNKAAGEMRQRVQALVPDCKVWISTFHSLGARLMRFHA